MRRFRMMMFGAVMLFTAGQAMAVANWLSDVSITTELVSSDATFSFEIEDAGGSSMFAFGNGTGDFDGGNADGFGAQSSLTDGTATYPPASGFAASHETHDRIRVDNDGSSAPAVLEFTVTFDAESMVGSTAEGDMAASGYNIHITGIGDPADAPGETAEFSIDGGTTFESVLRLEDALAFPALPAGAAEFQLDVAQMVAGMGGSDSASNSGTVIVRYTTPPDTTTAFSIFTRAGGKAVANGPAAVVPEPATLGLAGLAAAALLARRRR